MLGPWTINTSDRYNVGDLNGDGTDKLFCTNGTNLQSGILYLNAGTWTSEWSNGTGSIGGYNIPQANDAILIGNLDNSPDKEDDIFMIQGNNTSGATWATTEDLVNNVPTWKWSNHNSPWTGTETGYINDWPLADPTGSIPTYMLIKPVSTDPPYLLAMRGYGCGNHYLVSMYKTSNANCPTCVSYSPIKPSGSNPDSLPIKSIADIKVYPNPNNGIYTVAISNAINQNATIEVYNIYGQMIKSIPSQQLQLNSDNLIEINMADEPSGQYIVKCVTDNTVKVVRVTIANNNHFPTLTKKARRIFFGLF